MDQGTQPDESVAHKRKKYKLWKDDPSVPIPLKTLQRWEKKRNDGNNITQIDNNTASATSISPEANCSNSGCNNATIDPIFHRCDHRKTDYSSDGTNEDVNAQSDDGISDQEYSPESDDTGASDNNDNSIGSGLSDTGDVGSDGENDSMTDNESNGSSKGSENNFRVSKSLSAENIDIDNQREDSRQNNNENNCNNLENNAGEQEPPIVKSCLYENCTGTVDEAVLDWLELFVDQKLSKKTLELQLQALQKILPRYNKMPKTVYQFLKYVQQYAPKCNVIKHFFCKDCLCYSQIQIAACPECDSVEMRFFFELDIRDQIRHLFEKRNLAAKLKSPQPLRDNNIITDLTDGSEYVRVNSHHNRHKYDLTLMLNTDGISLIKSSSDKHCWPVMCTIAELHPSLRSSFIVVIGLWFNDCKPNMNTFLQPLFLKLRDCFEEGVQWVDPTTKQSHTSKVLAPLIVADAPARADVQNILHHNGQYGCNTCEIETKNCKPQEGKKRHRIYPYKSVLKLRTGRVMEEQGLSVVDPTIPIKGVKGPSAVSILPEVDLATCVIPEYMHSVLLGPVKQFLKVWMTKKGDFSIKNSVNEIDRFLLSVKPLQSFNRMPKSLQHWRLFKASELYNWLLYYSLPTLINYLPEEYFEHWMLLVIAIFTLLQDKILIVPDLEKAEDLLKTFVKNVEPLYGDRELTYNVHQLLHLCTVVRRWGPLWCNSAFPFENFNGFIAGSIHGTKHLGQEIINQLDIARGRIVLKYHVDENKVSAQKRRQNEFLGAACKKNRDKFIMHDSEIELLRLEMLDSENVELYARANIDNEIYTSEIYKNTATNNYSIQIFLNDDDSEHYGSIRFFFALDNEICFMLHCFNIVQTKIFFNRKTRAQVHHIIPVERNNRYLIVKYSNINKMCHVIKVGEYICKRPNGSKQVM